MLHVTEAEVRRLLPFPKAIELVQQGYAKLARGEAENPERVWLQVPNGASTFFMPGYVHRQKRVIVKVARVNASNSRVSLPTVLLTVYVYDAKTGVQVAEVEGEWLTAVRTAASTAAATDFLARKNVSVLGIFGTGLEASTHIPALMLVRDFDRILVYSPNRKRRKAFVEKMARDSGVRVETAENPDHVSEESDVIVTVTTSSSPVFEGRRVRKGSHVNAIGSGTPEKREVDTSLVKRSMIIVDSRGQAVKTYGDIISPIKENAIRESQILELGNLLIGRSRFPNTPSDVTLFKSGGLAVLDAMVTNYILDSIG